MSRRAVLALMLLAGCAIGRVHGDDVAGIALGRARIESCLQTAGSPGGSMLCHRIDGGAVSDNGRAIWIEALEVVAGALAIVLPVVI